MASIKQQANGKWRYRIRYKQNGSFKEYSKSGFRLKSEAVAEASEMELKLKKGHNLQDASILISTYMQMWLSIKKDIVKKSTYSRFERAIRIHINPKFGFYKLNELSRMDCVNWIADLCKTSKVNSVKTHVAPLVSALDDAVYEYRLLEMNPMKNIKYPKQAKNKSDIKFYEKDVMKELLCAADNHEGRNKFLNFQYYVLTYLLARTGLRLGEALALNWADVNEENLTVSKTLYREKDKDYITPPKTDSSFRTISLDKSTLSLLKKLKLTKMKEALRTKIPNLTPEIVFSDMAGNYMKQSNYRTFFILVCKKADIPVLSPHALRHSHAVHLLESGSNIKFVSERLGHSSINMTANVYLHISKKIEKDALKKYENYF